MFESSTLLSLKHIFINFIIPIIPGIIFIWICFGYKLKGILLHLLSWFIGVGIISFSLLNLQFIYIGIGIVEYLLILLLLTIVFIVKIYVRKENIVNYFGTLKIKNISSEIVNSFKKLSIVEKIFSIVIIIFSFGFTITTSIYSINFPTYADDSFGNRNRPAINIYHDNGIKFFGDKTEILGRGRLGYPIHIPLYKAEIMNFTGGFNDIYINMRQYLLFIFFLFFIFTITFKKTKNIFYSLLPIGLIISLPLVFFHAMEGYMEIASTVYIVLVIRSFSKYLEKYNTNYLSLGLLLGFILSYIKNDGFIVYFPGVIISLITLLIIKGKFKEQLLNLWKNKNNLIQSIFFFFFFFLPFLLVKFYHNLGFNQAAGNDSGVGISKTMHWEIFSSFKNIFINMDNYNLIIIILIIIFFSIFKKRKKRDINNKLLVVSPIIIFSIFILVFLLTKNYLFVLNQTTVNRVFSMSFIILFSFSGLMLSKEGN